VTDLLKANVFGILPKASPTNIQSVFSNKAMMVEANTAVEKEKTQLLFSGMAHMKITSKPAQMNKIFMY